MEIRRLRHFLYLAEEKRFAAAAERAHLSQAAFSRSIQSLEERLQVRLFDRSPQGATLTPAGELLQQRARALVADSQGLALDMALFRTGDAGELAIGAAPVPAATLVPELLCRLKEHRPKLVTRIRIGYLPDLLTQLEAHTLDLCFGDPRLLIANRDRYETRPIGKQYGYLCCRAQHPLANKPTLSAQDINTCGLAMIAVTPELHNLIKEHLQLAADAPLPLSVECDDFGTLTRLIARSDVLGLLPASLLDQGHQGSQPLKRLRRLGSNDNTAIFADVHALWLKNRTLSPSAERAIALAQAINDEAPSHSD